MEVNGSLVVYFISIQMVDEVVERRITLIKKKERANSICVYIQASRLIERIVPQKYVLARRNMCFCALETRTSI